MSHVCERSNQDNLNRGRETKFLHLTIHNMVHMGQFLQGGKNGRLKSFFFLKVEP